MKNLSIIILSINLLILNCSKTKSLDQNDITQFQNLIESAEDSFSIALKDTAFVNPILAKLSEKYDWESEKEKWLRNPFLKGTRKKTKVVKTNNIAPIKRKNSNSWL